MSVHLLAKAANASAPQIDPFQVMTSAKQLPVQHFVDYSLVFN
jgi:hypothetical protein